MLNSANEETVYNFSNIYSNIQEGLTMCEFIFNTATVAVRKREK